MKKLNLSNYIILISTALLVLLGLWLFSSKKVFKKETAANTTVILEQIQKVTKLITIEGHFSELYSHKEGYKYDFFNLFEKKIIIRVNAKVSVGYDFKKVNMTIDSTTKTVTLNELPKAEILSVDHDLDYYDINEGIFTSFSPAEYNQLNKNAKNFIIDKSATSQLIEKAEQEKQEYIDMLRLVLKGAGWKFVVGTPILSPMLN